MCLKLNVTCGVGYGTGEEEVHDRNPSWSEENSGRKLMTIKQRSEVSGEWFLPSLSVLAWRSCPRVPRSLGP